MGLKDVSGVCSVTVIKVAEVKGDRCGRHRPGEVKLSLFNAVQRLILAQEGERDGVVEIQLQNKRPQFTTFIS